MLSGSTIFRVSGLQSTNRLCHTKLKKSKTFLPEGQMKKVKYIKENIANTKFNVRCSRFLYTLVITGNKRVEKRMLLLPPGRRVKEIKYKKVNTDDKNEN